MPLKVTVITAVYNGAQRVAEAVKSVQAQTYPDVQHVIIDGASSDGTLEILKGLVRPSDILISERDFGIYDALNKGLRYSLGDVVGFLHSDDIFADNDVLAHVAHAFRDPALSGIYGDLDYVAKDNTSEIIRRWRSGPFQKFKLQQGWMPPHPTLYVRRNWYERIHGFDTRYRISADYFSILNLFSQSDFRSVHLPHVLVKMRVGGASNRSIKNIIRKSMEDFDATRRSGFPLCTAFAALLGKNFSKLGQFL